MRWLGLLGALPLVASAQTTTFTVDSLWAPWASTVAVTCFASLLDSKAQKLVDGNVGPLKQLQTSVQTNFAAQPGAMTVTFVRLTCSQVGTNWRGSSVLIAAPPKAIPVPAGKTVSVQYIAPLTGVGGINFTVKD